jgi:hypothetical protein
MISYFLILYQILNDSIYMRVWDVSNLDGSTFDIYDYMSK